MTNHRATIHELLGSLERAFTSFERGHRTRLFDSRDDLVQLSDEVERGGWTDMVPLCDVIAKLLGRVLREGTLDEDSAIAVVRDLLGIVEGGLERDPGGVADEAEPSAGSGVFRVVNESKVGEMLVKMGKIHPAQVQQALVLQRVSKDKRFGEVLIAMNAIDPRTLEEALRDQHATPAAPPGGLHVDPSDPEAAESTQVPDAPTEGATEAEPARAPEEEASVDTPPTRDEGPLSGAA